MLVPTVEGLRENLNALGEPADVLTKATLTADAGYASEANMRYVFDAGIDAYIADTQFQRDPRFKETDRYKVRTREDHGTPRLFRPRTSPTTRPNAPVSVLPASGSIRTAPT